jgi:hypothetical protein
MIYITGHQFKYNGNINPRIRNIFNNYTNFNATDLFSIVTIRNNKDKKIYTFENKTQNCLFNIEFNSCEEAENLIATISNNIDTYQTEKNKILEMYSTKTD